MNEIVKIPEKRVPILIGKNGEVRRRIEEKTDTKLEIEENVIEISGDPIKVMKTKDVIKAIGRGFSPINAYQILEDKLLLIITIEEKGEGLRRIRSRLIGSNGKCRESIEELTDTKVSIYGKTVSIIGKHKKVELAKKAVQMIINGSPHKTVYNYLENPEKAVKL